MNPDERALLLLLASAVDALLRDKGLIFVGDPTSPFTATSKHAGTVQHEIRQLAKKLAEVPPPPPQEGDAP